jgi:hypothetical protein
MVPTFSYFVAGVVVAGAVVSVAGVVVAAGVVAAGAVVASEFNGRATGASESRIDFWNFES